MHERHGSHVRSRINAWVAGNTVRSLTMRDIAYISASVMRLPHKETLDQVSLTFAFCLHYSGRFIPSVFTLCVYIGLGI